jgi:hypothetical protein
VREAEERLGLPEPASVSVWDGEPPELDQPRLVRVQFQAELREPPAKILQEPLGVVTGLERGLEHNHPGSRKCVCSQPRYPRLTAHTCSEVGVVVL